MLCFTFLAISAHAAEHRIGISPLLTSLGSKFKSSYKKSAPRCEVSFPVVNKDLTDKEIVLLNKYSLLDRDSSGEALSSSFPFTCDSVHRSKAYASCKLALSKKIDSHVSKVASILLDLDFQYSLFDSESTQTLKSLADCRCNSSIESSLARLECLDRFVSKAPILVPQRSARITSHFGPRRVSKKRISQHAGTDMTSSKPIVYAAADGVVVSCAWMRGYGNILTIDHGGIRTRYAHLSKFYVKPGMIVKQGQEIALEGATGRARGRHLHFEVLLRGKQLDPMSFIACSMNSGQMLVSQAILARQNGLCKSANSSPINSAVAKLPSKETMLASASARTKTNVSASGLLIASQSPAIGSSAQYVRTTLPATRVLARSSSSPSYSTAYMSAVSGSKLSLKGYPSARVISASGARPSSIGSHTSIISSSRPVLKGPVGYTNASGLRPASSRSYPPPHFISASSVRPGAVSHTSVHIAFKPALKGSVGSYPSARIISASSVRPGSVSHTSARIAFKPVLKGSFGSSYPSARIISASGTRLSPTRGYTAPRKGSRVISTSKSRPRVFTRSRPVFKVSCANALPGFNRVYLRARY